MALLAPKFLDCVVAIGYQTVENKTSWNATGFLYGNCVGEATPPEKGYEYETFLVTNRHVLEDMEKIILRFNPKGKEAAKTFPVPLLNQNGKPRWADHTDKNIDLAVIRISANTLNEHKIAFAHFLSNFDVLSTEGILENGIAEGDFVYILGFPMGLVGDHRNAVIARSGSIARIQDLLDKNSNRYLVDSFVFPGNSGGPVILRPEINWVEGTKASNKSYLIGIVQSYVPYEDVAISQQRKQPRIIFHENSGLTYVHPVEYIEETINHWHSMQKAGDFE